MKAARAAGVAAVQSSRRLQREFGNLCVLQRNFAGELHRSKTMLIPAFF